MSKYGVISAPNTGKYGPEITQYLDTFQSADRSHEGAYNKYPTNFFTSNYGHKSSKEKEKQLSKTTVIGPYKSESPLKHGTTINLC